MFEFPELDSEVSIPPATSSYPELGVSYTSSATTIRYSSRLVMLRRKDRYERQERRLCTHVQPITLEDNEYFQDVVASFPPDTRLSTAAEEFAIQLEMGDENVRKNPFFWPYLHEGCVQRTLTSLRVPSGEDSEKTHEETRKYRRILVVNGNEIGEVLVPMDGIIPYEGDEGVLDHVSGLPIATKPDPYEVHDENLTTHLSLHHDFKSADELMVLRSGLHHHTYGTHCLSVRIGDGLFDNDYFNGFRLVQGPLPKIEKISI